MSSLSGKQSIKSVVICEELHIKKGEKQKKKRKNERHTDPHALEGHFAEVEDHPF